MKGMSVRFAVGVMYAGIIYLFVVSVAWAVCGRQACTVVHM